MFLEPGMLALAIGGGVLGLFLLMFIIALFRWYRIVDPSSAHLVVTPKSKMVISSDEKVQCSKKKRSYFSIPSYIPFIGRTVRVVDLTIRELVLEQETYEINQARYQVSSSTKYRIVDVRTAGETFKTDDILEEQLKEVIKASVRAVTVKYDVVDARAKKQIMSKEIVGEIEEDFKQWGIQLVNFQLVNFQDTKESTIISDISRRREVEIQSRTRQENAERVKEARIKEAEAEQKAREREIEKDEVISVRDQNKQQKIAEQAKVTREKEYFVKEVEIVRQAEIDKQQAIIRANQDRETEEIKKVQKQLEGEGERLKAEEIAKAEAAPIREKGIAEAMAKEKLQEALNKFKDEAIKALVAEKIVEKDKEVGVAIAQALAKAEMKVFLGGSGSDSEGFELGKLLNSIRTADDVTGSAVLNNIARPNDLGFKALGLQSVDEMVEKEEKAKK
ncbi:MAG: SPFH domain-containing protein [Spirochaetales bacterium]|nr:SPFH domain-containing protein [Spirochaetales bacterium]